MSRLSGSSSQWNHLFHTRDYLSRWSHLLQHRNHLFQTRDYLSLHQDHLPGTKPRLICQGYQGLSVPLESSVPTSELSVLTRDYLSPGVICSNQDHFPTSIISHYQDHFPIILVQGLFVQNKQVIIDDQAHFLGLKHRYVTTYSWAKHYA